MPLQFDDIPTGTAVWNGLTVVDPLQYSMNPKSKPNVAMGYAIGASIEATDVIMEFVSFWFACVAQPYGGPYLPTDCDVLVISEADTPVIDIVKSGPYHYTWPGGYDHANMTKATVKVTSGTFYFVVISGPSYPLLLLDNLVTVDYGNCPY